MLITGILKNLKFSEILPMQCTWSVLKRGSLLGNEETDLGGDSPIFEIIYSNLEQRSIFSKKSTHFYVQIKIGMK